MSPSDQRHFLRVLDLMGSLHPGYTYLEVGSDRGGSIIAPLMDERCGRLVSVDLRPMQQPDERGRMFPFPDNTTEGMLLNLRREGVPPERLAVLRTFDADLGSLPFFEVNERARLAFIDAEHTNQAVFRDFLHVRRFLEEDGVVVFHDANLVYDALENIRIMLEQSGALFSAFYVPDTLFVLGLGSLANESRRAFAGQILEPESFIVEARRALHAEIARSVRETER